MLESPELSLVRKYPREAWIVYKQKNQAEGSTNLNFPEQGLNDESDAFRHFMWSGLLTKELGFKKAKQFLDAHEVDPDQPKPELEMDLLNNKIGQETAETLIKEKKWSLRALEQSGLDALKNKKLKVIKPRLSVPEKPL